jgi:hypothetical protein
MAFHPDASLPDRHAREPYGPPDYCSAFYYLTEVTTSPRTPAFCVVPGSMRCRSLSEAREVSGDWVAVPRKVLLCPETLPIGSPCLGGCTHGVSMGGMIWLKHRRTSGARGGLPGAAYLRPGGHVHLGGHGHLPHAARRGWACRAAADAPRLRARWLVAARRRGAVASSIPGQQPTQPLPGAAGGTPGPGAARHVQPLVCEHVRVGCRWLRPCVSRSPTHQGQPRSDTPVGRSWGAIEWQAGGCTRSGSG